MDCIRVLLQNGVYSHVPDAPAEFWEDILYDCDSYQHLESLRGWGKFTDAYKVVLDEKVYYYFVEMPVW